MVESGVLVAGGGCFEGCPYQVSGRFWVLTMAVQTNKDAVCCVIAPSPTPSLFTGLFLFPRSGFLAVLLSVAGRWVGL